MADRWALLATIAGAIVFGLGFWVVPDPAMDWSREMIPRCEVVDLARAMRTRWSAAFAVVVFFAVASFESTLLPFALAKVKALLLRNDPTGKEAKEDAKERSTVPERASPESEPEEQQQADPGASPEVRGLSRPAKQVAWEDAHDKMKGFDLSSLGLPRLPPDVAADLTYATIFKKMPATLWALFKDSSSSKLIKNHVITNVVLDDPNLGASGEGDFTLTQTMHCKASLYGLNSQALMVEFTCLSMDMSSEFRPSNNPGQRVQMQYMARVPDFWLEDVQALKVANWKLRRQCKFIKTNFKKMFQGFEGDKLKKCREAYQKRERAFVDEFTGKLNTLAQDYRKDEETLERHFREETEKLMQGFSEEKQRWEQDVETEKKDRDNTIRLLRENSQRDAVTIETQRAEMQQASKQIALSDARGARLGAAAAATWTRDPMRAHDFRPLRFLRVISSSHPERRELLVESTHNTVAVSEDGRNYLEFSGFNHVFDQHYENKHINFVLGGLLDHVFCGHKSLVLTDGYSGSGKTSTLLWKGKGHDTIAQFVGSSLLRTYESISISASEITDKEAEVRPMEPAKRKSANVEYHQEGRARGRYLIKAREGLDAVLKHIDATREKRATAQNDGSSRSHVKVCIQGSGEGRFYLLDVCGGEEGERDSIMINKGRSDLRTYIQKCGEREGQPARNHALTKSLEGILLPMKQWTSEERSKLPKTALISHLNLRHPLKSTRNVLEFATGDTGVEATLDSRRLGIELDG